MDSGAHLLLLLPEGEVRVALREGTTALGTAPGSTVVLHGEGIAAHHCVIQSEGERFEVFDLLSPAGTLVNGAKAEAQILQHGDQLRIGPLRLVFLQPDALHAAPAAQKTQTAAHADTALPPADFEASFVNTLGRVPFHAGSVIAHVLLLLCFVQLSPDNADRTAVPQTVGLTLDSMSGTALPADTAREAEAVTQPAAAQPSLSALLTEQTSAATATAPHETSSTGPLSLSGASSLQALAAAQHAGTGTGSGPGSSSETSAAESLGFGLGLSGGSADSGIGGGAGADVALRAGGSAFRQRVYALQGSGLDVAVVIDSTSSMTSVLDAARDAVGGIVASIATLVPKFRLAVVTYRDVKDEYVTRQSPFTASPWTAVHFLEGVKADGGGDAPEAVLEALKTALQRLVWNHGSKRVILLVGDAPPHAEDLAAIQALVSAQSARTTIHTLVTPHGGLSSGRSSANPLTVAAFADIAKAGKGVSKLLVDASAVVPAMLAGAFGPDQEAALQRAIAALDNSLAVRGARRLIERGDLNALLDALQKEPPPAHLLRLLLEQAKPPFTPVYLHLLEDPKAPQAARHAAAVLLHRALRQARVGPAALALVAALDPKTGSGKFSTQVRELRRLLERDERSVPLNMPRRP